ncbi:MAG: DNA phosphorothioation-associated DGQHR protein 1 [Gammaproteobacteria bacterium]|nr:DNA phosphorothioation-associated DGQHR protein 1 [Gammaproteobacteria bacterium]
MTKFPFETDVLRVDQRIGTFFVAVLPAELLLQVAASDRMSATMNPDGNGYRLEGTQRVVQDRRLNEIADYIGRTDAAFPNSIILASNYERNSGFDQDEWEDIQSESGGSETEVSKEWTVTPKTNGRYRLKIPTGEKLAAVIDGQHRLFAFAKADIELIREMKLLCSIFLDLPKSLQAQLFATINSTQKRVDRSLTFELFGYNVADEREEFWTPDKLAVFFTRKLSTNDDSPLQGKILVAPKRDSALLKLASQADWQVSTAVVVDGVLRLFSSNPKRDSNAMNASKERTRSCLAKGPRDRSPLRSAYISGNDALLYKTVLNYVKACDDVFWSDFSTGSFIVRTVGVQAVFDILRKLAPQAYKDRDISVGYFVDKIDAARRIDFSDERFKNASGSGRTFIRKTIEHQIGLEM